MTESIQNMFRILGSKLKGRDKKYLDKIESEYYEIKDFWMKAQEISEEINIIQENGKLITIDNKDYGAEKIWMSTPEILEQFYRDKLEENEDLLTEISLSNEIIKIQSAQLERMEGDKKGLKETKKIIKRNEKRIANLNNVIQKLKNERENIKKTKKSYARRIGWANQWYDEVLSALEEIYKCCENRRLRNIDNFKEKIQKICEEHLEFCTKCENLKSDCICKN